MRVRLNYILQSKDEHSLLLVIYERDDIIPEM
jgi:hypothetical protein